MRRIIPLLFASLLFTSCGDTFKGRHVAEPQIAVFHKRLDAGEYDEIYYDAAGEFRKATSKEKMNELLSAINRKLGAVQASAVTNWRVTTRNRTTYVVLVSETRFENGSGTETFTFIVSGSNADLIGYNINSVDMMIK